MYGNYGARFFGAKYFICTECIQRESMDKIGSRFFWLLANSFFIWTAVVDLFWGRKRLADTSAAVVLLRDSSPNSEAH
ncbi:hypothetical protein JG559_08440 [Enterococcus faecalis]|uniref:Uncharacterized protein n=1 Tax=Enterococcus faecalis TaxID=1351 RepID=A0A974NYN4_ENTFL|nr:hypothetical protein JG559_08440 [Enterococcus faecalis]